MSRHFVIIGNGAAGFRAAKALRRADSAARISIFTQERYPFYLRRQLGDFLTGNLTLTELIFQSRNTYRRERIDLFLMTRITAVDPAAHEVVFASGERVRYDRLLVATGTDAVPLDIPGAALDGVVQFDTLRGAVAVRRALDQVRRAVVLEAGLVGLKLAESLADRGVGVTQLISGDRYWPEMLDEAASQSVEAMMEDAGIALRRNADARAIIGTGGSCIGVETADGKLLGAELVATGSRRRPATDALKGSGIDLRRGVCVDSSLRTSDPDVFAAGDVAEPTDAPEFADASTEPDGNRTPFCWQRAWTQGGQAAAGMLDQATPTQPGAVRMRTNVFGREITVIGAGHLPEGEGREAVQLQGPPDTYRRLVFERGRLVGATILGTGESVPELDRLVAEGAAREEVETAIEPAEAAPGDAARTPQTFARHCPICAAELVIRCGAPAGSQIRCRACSTSLVIQWDGESLWLEVSRP